MDSDDLCTLKNLDEDSLLEILEKRYNNSQIFTNSGLFLISINPYKNTDLFNDELAQSYRENHNKLQPHIFSIIEQCKRDKSIYGEHTVVINGDSGAGKTECTKYMLKYLGLPALNDVNDILECLGNCKTNLNDNSSRFGKLIRLDNTIKIETYLLEKSRVTGFADGERNFHIFYYILANRKETLCNDFINFDVEKGVMDLSGNSYVNQFDSKSDHSFSNLQSVIKSYNVVLESFKSFSIDFKEIEQILLGVIYLGSIKIENNQIFKDEKYSQVVELLNLNELVFEDLLLRKKLKINNEEIIRPLSMKESIIVRNSLARLIYECLFHYVLDKINEKLDLMKTNVEKLNILDIFGFENFDDNGLDQFCINWSNEHLHDHFVKDAFEYQKNLLISEGVNFQGTDYEKLNNCKLENTSLELIQKKVGLVDLISEECTINGNASNLALKIKKYLGLRINPVNKMVFRHFNGDVSYSLEDFIDKNRERCKLNTIPDLFNEVSPVLKHSIQKQYTSQNLIDTYRKNLMSLMDIIKNTKVKYIKCIKPNEFKEPLRFDRKVIMKQLKSSGIFESVLLSKHLFPHNLEINKFKRRYPFSVLDEKYLTIGNKMVFFNNDGLLDLERRLSDHIELQKRRIKSLFNIIFTKRLFSELIQAKKPVGIACESSQVTKFNPKNNEINFKNDSKVVSELRSAEECCFTMVSEIEEQLSQDIQSLKTIEESIKNSSTLEEENRQLKKVISDLKNELKVLKQLKISSKSVNNCIFDQKFDYILDQQSKNPVKELEKLQKKFVEISGTEASKTSLYGIFKSIIHLFIENIPVYSQTKYSKDEVFSFAHSIYYVVTALFEQNVKNSFGIFMTELEKQVPCFQENLSHVIFLLNNLIELRSLFKDRMGNLHIFASGTQSIGSEETPVNLEIEFVTFVLKDLDISIKNLMDHCGLLISEILSDILPYSILDYEPLRQMNGKKDSFIKRLFSGPSIDRLVQYLEYFYNLCEYFYTQNSIKIAIISYALSSIDQITFNSLMTKRMILNSNKCYEIKHNLSEIEKFCFNIGFKDGFLNLIHMNEAMKIMSAVSRLDLIPKSDRTGIEYEKEYKIVKETVENSFLPHLQTNVIITKFEDNTLFLELPCDGNRDKILISSPKMIVPDVNTFFSESKFVEPSYLPEKQLMNILKYFYEC